MTGVQAALALFGITALACALMIAFVLERKLRRDKREWISRRRRERLRRALEEADREVILMAAARATGDAQAQVDFAVTASQTVDGLGDPERERLHRTVGEIGLIESLTEQLGSRSSIERGRAAFLLGELRVPEAERILHPLLADPDPDVRLVACAELGGIATPAAARSLISGLMAGDLAPERIIERLAGRWAVPTMFLVLEDEEMARSLYARARDSATRLTPVGEPSERWRPSVARALGVAADPRAELALARLLDSEQVEDRVAAARALGPSGSGASVAVLVAALDDPAWEVRAQAAKALAFHPDHQAVPALERRLADEAWWVRSNVADTLAELGGEGIEALRRALSHQDRFARERAQEALALHRLAVA